MDKNYIKLFQEIAHALEVLSEQVMDIEKTNNNEKGLETSTVMREKYSALYDKIRETEFNPETLTRSDYSHLLVGAIVLVQQFERKITEEQKVIQGYKQDMIPKLTRVINETKTDDEAHTLANEIFQITEKPND